MPGDAYFPVQQGVTVQHIENKHEFRCTGKWTGATGATSDCSAKVSMRRDREPLCGRRLPNRVGKVLSPGATQSRKAADAANGAGRDAAPALYRSARDSRPHRRKSRPNVSKPLERQIACWRKALQQKRRLCSTRCACCAERSSRCIGRSSCCTRCTPPFSGATEFINTFNVLHRDTSLHRKISAPACSEPRRASPMHSPSRGTTIRRDA